MNKKNYPDRLKNPQGQSLQKLRIKRQSNCIRSVTVNLGHPVIKRPPIRSICKSKTRNWGNSKLLGRIAVTMFNEPFPYIYHFSIFFAKSMEPCHWRVTTPFIKFEPVPIYLELRFILFAKFLLFSMTIIEAKKKIQNTKLFLHLLKSVNNKHTLFELLSRRNVHQHLPRKRLHSRKETWQNTMERTSTSSKMQSRHQNTKKIQKELAKMKIWKGGLGNRERPSGLKTWKGGPGKN